MADRDIAKKRRRNLERFHQRSAERRAAGLCLKCGKAEPAPERTLCEPCLEKRRAADRARTARLQAEGKPRRDVEKAREYERERSRHQHAERRAAGICTKCGKAPASPERTLCQPCAEVRRAHDRVRHAKAKAQGTPYGGRDPEARRRADRERSRRRSQARRAAGICVRCGNAPPAEGRAMCEPCREDRRQAKRDRNRERRAAGLCVTCATPTPGGKAYCDPCAAVREERRRRNPGARLEAGRRRYAERRARGDCPKCGKPANGAAECQSCREAARARYDARRAAGVCVKCKTPTLGGTAYCAPCLVAKEERRDREAEYAAKRARYAERRAKGRCVQCNAPSPGEARCEPCSRRHRESSGAFRGIPIWDPTWTVIEIATGREHGPYNSEADVALCLVFEKLARDEVEVLCDASLMSSYTAPPW